MPCVARRTNKTHHLPLNPCVLVIIHVYVAFRADLAAISGAEEGRNFALYSHLELGLPVKGPCGGRKFNTRSS